MLVSGLNSREDQIHRIAQEARRPCTVEDASQGLSAAPNEVVKALEVLQARGRVKSRLQGNQTFYMAQTDSGPVPSSGRSSASPWDSSPWV
jgi:hypothetical protein